MTSPSATTVMVSARLAPELLERLERHRLAAGLPDRTAAITQLLGDALDRASAEVAVMRDSISAYYGRRGDAEMAAYCAECSPDELRGVSIALAQRLARAEAEAEAALRGGVDHAHA